MQATVIILINLQLTEGWKACFGQATNWHLTKTLTVNWQILWFLADNWQAEHSTLTLLQQNDSCDYRDCYIGFTILLCIRYLWLYWSQTMSCFIVELYCEQTTCTFDNDGCVEILVLRKLQYRDILVERKFNFNNIYEKIPTSHMCSWMSKCLLWLLLTERYIVFTWRHWSPSGFVWTRKRINTIQLA